MKRRKHEKLDKSDKLRKDAEQKKKECKQPYILILRESEKRIDRVPLKKWTFMWSQCRREKNN